MDDLMATAERGETNLRVRAGQPNSETRPAPCPAEGPALEARLRLLEVR